MNKKNHNVENPANKSTFPTQTKSAQKKSEKNPTNKTCSSSRPYCCEQLFFYPLYDKEKE